jgi:hypothetical protein
MAQEGESVAKTGDDVSPLPSAIMSASEYLRIHANAPPSKLRNLIKTRIFPRDDVNYLKRLVGDIGHMEYVFRFLWYDGPKPVSYFEEWDDTSTKLFNQFSCGSAEWNESPTRGESNWGSSTTYSSKRMTATSQSANEPQSSPARGSIKLKETRRPGRTWIEYCCYYNAHQCLQWIFREVVRNHLEKIKQEQEKLASENSKHGLHGSLSRQPNSRKLSKCGDGMYVINQLLGYPSRCYCATNYVAVGKFFV